MKAFVLAHSEATTIELTDIPKPEIAADELLVRVHDFYFLPHDA